MALEKAKDTIASNPVVVFRMETRSSVHQQTSGEVISSQPEASVQASDPVTAIAFPLPQPLEDPLERTFTTLTQKVFSHLCTQHGILETDALLPGRDQCADLPPFGFVAVNRQMCSSGAIPPFNSFLETILRRLSIAPFQLHPNGYAILLGLCVLFRRTFNRLPSFDEICFLCTFGKSKDHPSIIYVRSARNRRLITDLPDSAHGFLSQYFYVRCPAAFYGIWMIGVIPSPFKNSNLRSTFDNLKAVSEEERSIRFLLKNEFLHQYGLLEPSKSIISREVSSSLSLRVEVFSAPASSGVSALKDPALEAALKKCSVPFDGTGSSEIFISPSVSEEEKISQRSGRALIGTIKELDEEILAKKNEVNVKKTPAELPYQKGDNSSIFGDLNDILITSQKLFSVVTSKPIAVATEVTSVSKAITTPKSQRGFSMDRTYYKDFRNYGGQGIYDFKRYLPSYQETPKERGAGKAREDQGYKESRRSYDWDEHHDHSQRDDDSQKRKRSHESDDPSKRSKAGGLSSSNVHATTVPTPSVTLEIPSSSPALPKANIQKIIQRPSCSIPQAPSILGSRFPNWCLRGVRFDLDRVPIDKDLMLKNLDAVKLDVDMLSNWQKLVDELQRVNKCNQEAKITMENDKSEWEKVLKERDDEISNISAHNKSLEDEIKRLKEELAVSSSQYNQREAVLKDQIKEAYLAQIKVEGQLKAEQEVVTGYRNDATKMLEKLNSQSLEISTLQVQIARVEQERDQAIAEKDAAETEINSTLFDFYVHSVLSQGSLEFLGPKYELTLAEVWERILIIMEGCGYTEEELEISYLNDNAREALAKGKMQLLKDRVEVAGIGSSKKSSILDPTLPTASTDAVIISTAPPVQTSEAAEAPAEDASQNIVEKTSSEIPTSAAQLTPPPSTLSPSLLLVTSSSQSGSQSKQIEALTNLDDPAVSPEKGGDGIDDEERTPCAEKLQTHFLDDESTHKKRQHRKRVVSKKKDVVPSSSAAPFITPISSSSTGSPSGRPDKLPIKLGSGSRGGKKKK